MTDPLGLFLASLERRLERSTRDAPTPDLRQRILVAVDDVLRERAVPSAAVPAGVVPGWAWATALAAAIAVTLPLLHAAASLDRLERLSFAERLRAAGLADEEWLAIAPSARDIGTSRAVPPRNVRNSRPVLRVTGVRALLEENL